MKVIFPIRNAPDDVIERAAASVHERYAKLFQMKWQRVLPDPIRWSRVICFGE